jgi:hypothetical protein
MNELPKTKNFIEISIPGEDTTRIVPGYTEEEMQTHAVRVHDFFFDSADAYNQTQWNEAIRNGDILMIKSEQVIGIADTWPVAVTKAFGSLHAVAPDADLLEHEELVKYRTSILIARKMAAELGWPT